MSPITVIPMSCKISWKKGVKSRIELNKRLHYTTLVPLIVLLFVRSTLSYMQIKSLFASNVNAHSASNHRTLSPLRPDTTSPPFLLVWLKVPVLIVLRVDVLARADLLGPLTAVCHRAYYIIIHVTDHVINFKIICDVTSSHHVRGLN